MISIKMEESFLQEDMKRLEDLHSRWVRELSRYENLQDTFYQILIGEEKGQYVSEEMALDIQAQWNYLKTLKDALEQVQNRILERKRRIEVLSEEAKKTREEERKEDPITGTWDVVINPGEQKGTFILKLSGVLVSGEYTLEGGWKGSLRGTLVGESVRLERIDAEKGFMAVFYGRLSKEGEEEKKVMLKGTWESTQFGLGTAMTGTWVARRKE